MLIKEINTNTMTEQTLLRLAMVLQDKAPSTLDKYICKLATSVLVDYPEGLKKSALSQKLNEQFNLDFTEREIENAITSKGANDIREERLSKMYFYYGQRL